MTAHLTTDSNERKGIPLVSGVLDYFPLALAEVARLSKAGNDKHNPGQPLHWSRDKSNDHLDCVGRHLLEHGTVDDQGFLHDTMLAWRALANLQVVLEARRVANVSLKDTSARNLWHSMATFGAAGYNDLVDVLPIHGGVISAIQAHKIVRPDLAVGWRFSA